MKRGCAVLLAAVLLLSSSCALPEAPSAEPAPKAKIELTLTIVYDNNEYDQRLETKWGFSCLIEGLQKTILFDTGGDSATLLSNMKKLNIGPRRVNAVVLSHIHGDHIGGLSGFLEENSDVIVYLPQSFPQTFKEGVRLLGAQVDEVSEAKELFTGAYTTGELGNGTKEQSLIVTTSKGLVIITGCAHPGVVNIVREARVVAREDRVYLVMGGFHLGSASTSEVESVITEFRRLSVRKVAPCHCSGDETRRLFGERYGDDYIDNGVGKKITIP